MRKTSIYLDDEQADRLARLARAEDRPQAEIVREAAYLFTHDCGYLGSALREHGVEVIDPDSFLASVFDDASEGFLDLLELTSGKRTARKYPANRMVLA